MQLIYFTWHASAPMAPSFWNQIVIVKEREKKRPPPQLPNTTMTILHGFQQTFKVLNRSSILPYFLQQMKIVRYILVDFIAELGRGLPVSHKQ